MYTAKNKSLIGLAEAAIDRVFSDTSVSPQTTLDNLHDLEEDIHNKMAALQVDVRRQGRL